MGGSKRLSPARSGSGDSYQFSLTATHVGQKEFHWNAHGEREEGLAPSFCKSQGEMYIISPKPVFVSPFEKELLP